MTARDSEHLFNGFPQDVAWWVAELDSGDLARVLYINYEDWLEFSGGTRRATDAARMVASRQTMFAPLWDAIPHERSPSAPTFSPG